MFAFNLTSAFTGLRLPTQSPSLCRLHRPRSPPSHPRPHHPPQALLATESIINKSYQLEEDEDSLSCTSAIYLHADGSLSFGRTDGPPPDKVDASWRYDPSDGELLLEIERFFDADTRPFSVKRVLRGHLDDSRKNLSGLPVFAGGMYRHPADFSQNSEVGWWTMILAVDDLPDTDFDISSTAQQGAL